MTLARLQRDFRDRLLAAEPSAAPLGAKVYHNGYRVRLCDSLKETFERLLLWLGEEKFLAAARAHIERHPPRGWTLGVYGRDVPHPLLQPYPPRPAVALLARLDWMLCRAFDGADARAIGRPAPGLDWENARLRFVPTLQLAPARTNADAIWSALSAGETPPPAILLPAPGTLLVWRQELVPCFRSVESDEQDALIMMQEGASFGALCAFLVQRLGPDEGVARAGALLGQWLSEGLIAEIR